MAGWITPELPADATAHEVALAERYTRATKTVCEDWPDAHIVWLVVGPQRFRIADCETHAEAGWFRVMLARAMRTVRDETTAAVSIGEAQSYSWDEWYGEWFRCPNCEETSIARGFRYCPDCGVKLEWQESPQNADAQQPRGGEEG